jgi:hypothetical protein
MFQPLSTMNRLNSSKNFLIAPIQPGSEEGNNTSWNKFLVGSAGMSIPAAFSKGVLVKS